MTHPRWITVTLLVSLVSEHTAAQDARDTTPAMPADTSHAAPLTSQMVITGDFLSRLPIDDPRQALMLVPGVVLRSGDIGIAAAPRLSVRGSPLGEASVYIDGAPVRFETFGTQGLELGVRGIDAVTVTAGVPPVSVADARGGVISYITPAGGERIAGLFRGETDGPFGNGSTVGYNRLAGELGGPMPGVPGLTWFAASTLQGQGSPYYGRGAADQPAYVVGPLDQLVPSTDANGNTHLVPLQQYIQWSGPCGTTGNTATSMGQAIQSNYGFECQGLRRPMDWSTARRLQAKLSYSYGAGSSLSLSGFASDLEQRTFPGTNIGDALLYRGSRTWSRLGVLNWSHALGTLRGGPVTLNGNLSLGRDRQIAGPLDPSSEMETRQPALGMELKTLQFAGLDGFPFPITDDIIKNIRTNSGLRTPLMNNPIDATNVQAGRVNPYGMAFGGWFTSGMRTTATLVSETRYNGRVVADWAASQRHHITLGGEAQKTDLAYWTSQLQNQIFMDAYIVHPARFGLFAADQIALGELVLDVGARWDHYDSKALFPNVPSFISSNRATWSPNAATDPLAYDSSVARTFTPARGQGTVSPRLRAAYAVSQRTSLHAAYGQQVEPPSFGMLFANINDDQSFTNTSTGFGRDVAYAKTNLVELGARQAVGPNVTLDVSVYRKNHLTPYAGRFEPIVRPGSTPPETTSVIALTAVDGGHGTGVDARLDWHPGEALTGSVTYSYLRSNLGSNDITFLGACLSCQPDVATHALYTVAALHVPGTWREGTTLGAMARDVGALVTFRLTSGLPYTLLFNNGDGEVVPQSGLNLSGRAAEPINSSRLPTTKTLDLRLTKEIRAGGREWTVYADFRNLFNFRNVVGLFAETGDVSNQRFKDQKLYLEYISLAQEAQAAGVWAADSSISLTGSCASWGVPINCESLRRVEQRFGNGDGIYTIGEQHRALDTYYDSFFGPWRFLGPGRTIRVGLALGF
jgi:hypothetical protein